MSTIRPFQTSDRAAVRRICFETALWGTSIAAQYPHADSFADIVCAYFTDVEPENALVAEQNGQVVGYALGTRDARRVWSPLGALARHTLRHGPGFLRTTLPFYARALRDALDDRTAVGRPYVDLRVYPAQLHMNLSPSVRGGSLGRELMFGAFDRLAAQGIPGAHGDAFVNNPITRGYWQKVLGIRIVGAPYPVPGFRAPGGERVAACVGVRDLTGWTRGAWPSTPGFRGRA